MHTLLSSILLQCAPITAYQSCILTNSCLKQQDRISSYYFLTSSNSSPISSIYFATQVTKFQNRIGYNSIGGGASFNHLHFHLLFGEDLVGSPVLPIERQPVKLWKKTSLVNPKQDINLVTVFLHSTAQELRLSNLMDQLLKDCC